MDNHIHLVAIPERLRSRAVALRRAHGSYRLYLNARRSGHLGQNRFCSCALDEPHLEVALRYVERNASSGESGDRPEEYERSSAAAHLGMRPAPEFLDREFPARLGGAERWAGLLAEPEELIAIRALQRGAFTGRPVGDAGFVARLEEQLGRPLAPRQGQREPFVVGAVPGENSPGAMSLRP